MKRLLLAALITLTTALPAFAGSFPSSFDPTPEDYARTAQWFSVVEDHFPASEVNTAMCVMYGESRGTEDVTNHIGARGLFQIMPNWADNAWAGTEGISYSDLLDGPTNVFVARKVYDKQGWDAWSAYSRAYIKDCIAQEGFMGASGLTFYDTYGSIFLDNIEWLYAEGITVGCGELRYCPTDTVTRGEMAVFLTRLFGLSAEADHFKDDDGEFYENAANAIYEAGITVGVGEGEYGGDRDITRAEMAVMMNRALDLPDTEKDYFTDDDVWAEDAINRFAEAGITVGYGDGTYGPNDNVTRGQMAAFLQRAHNYMETQ